MKNMMKRTMMVTVVLSACLMPPPIMAENGGVGFSRNRLIYPAAQKAIKLTVSNHGDSPYLVQAGVSADPSKKASAPFVVTPPLFRLEGNSQNDIRIVAAGANLPHDRESVFYFLGTTIPGGDAPNDKEGSGATLSIAMRSVMKLFWRPEGLKPPIQEAPGKMQFIREARGVLVKNPTPYYQSFAYLAFDGKVQEPGRDASMIAPFGEQLFTSAVPVSKVTWQVMDDFGGTTKEVTQSLSTSGEK